MAHDLKEKAKRLIDGLPKLTSWDELIYAISVRWTIEAGLADSEAGRTRTVESSATRIGGPTPKAPLKLTSVRSQA